MQLEREAKELIGEGYLRVVRKLVLKNRSAEDMNFIHSHADGNQVEEFVIDRLPNEWWCQNKMADVFLKSKQAYKFTIILAVDCQVEVKQIRKLFRAAIHCNDRPKELEIIFLSFYVDWSLVKLATPTGRGSVKTLHFNCQYISNTAPDFSWLGPIETIPVNFEDYDDKLVSHLSAKCLSIELTIRSSPHFRNVFRRFRDRIRSKRQFQSVPPTQTVALTLVFFLEPMDDMSALMIMMGKREPDVNEKAKTFTATFDRDASTWENVIKWLVNVEVRAEEIFAQ